MCFVRPVALALRRRLRVSWPYIMHGLCLQGRRYIVPHGVLLVASVFRGGSIVASSDYLPAAGWWHGKREPHLLPGRDQLFSSSEVVVEDCSGFRGCALVEGFVPLCDRRPSGNKRKAFPGHNDVYGLIQLDIVVALEEFLHPEYRACQDLSILGAKGRAVGVVEVALVGARGYLVGDGLFLETRPYLVQAIRKAFRSVPS